MIVLGACGDYIGYIVLLSGSLPKVKVHTLLAYPKFSRIQKLWGQGVTDASTMEGSRSRL